MPKEPSPDKSKPAKATLKRNTSRVDSVQANAFFAKWGSNTDSKSSDTIPKHKKSTVIVSESEDELLLRSPKMKKKEKKKEIGRPTYTSSLEELQTSSPPSRSSSSTKRTIGSRGVGGAGPRPTKSAAKRSNGVFGGTINKYPRPPVHDSSAISRQSSLNTHVPKSKIKPGPKSATTPAPKSKVNPSRPVDNTKKSGLEAIRQSMRKPPKVEISAAQLQFERDYGPDLAPVLSKEEKQRMEELEMEKASAFEFLKNYKQTVEIELCVFLILMLWLIVDRLGLLWLLKRRRKKNLSSSIRMNLRKRN